MTNKDQFLLEKAYLAISQPVPSVPSDEDTVKLDTPSSDAMDDNFIDDGAEHSAHTDLSSEEDCWGDEESEEDGMTISNLHSIRDSVMKVSSFCAGGGHLETWQQQKLAIAMDNLAEVARRVR